MAELGGVTVAAVNEDALLLRLTTAEVTTDAGAGCFVGKRANCSDGVPMIIANICMTPTACPNSCFILLLAVQMQRRWLDVDRAFAEHRLELSCRHQLSPAEQACEQSGLCLVQASPARTIC